MLGIEKTTILAMHDMTTDMYGDLGHFKAGKE